LLAFENPALPDIDFGKSAYMMPKIRRSFEHAHQLLSAALTDSRIESYLSYVVRTDDALLIDRPAPELGARRYNQFEGLDNDKEARVTAGSSSAKSRGVKRKNEADV
jgi:hypothetical protein